MSDKTGPRQLAIKSPAQIIRALATVGTTFEYAEFDALDHGTGRLSFRLSAADATSIELVVETNIAVPEAAHTWVPHTHVGEPAASVRVLSNDPIQHTVVVATDVRSFLIGFSADRRIRVGVKRTGGTAATLVEMTMLPGRSL